MFFRKRPEPLPERTFKYCLSRVKTKARVTYPNGRLLIEVRPVKVDDFRKALDEHGASNEATAKAVQFLNENPGEYVRFAH